MLKNGCSSAAASRADVSNVQRFNRAASFADCVVPLGEDDRRELRRYWERVVRQEWVRPSRFVPSPVPSVAERVREQRQAARAMARAAAARRLAPVVSLSRPESGSGLAA